MRRPMAANSTQWPHAIEEKDPPALTLGPLLCCLPVHFGSCVCKYAQEQHVPRAAQLYPAVTSVFSCGLTQQCWLASREAQTNCKIRDPQHMSSCADMHKQPAHMAPHGSSILSRHCAGCFDLESMPINTRRGHKVITIGIRIKDQL